MRRRIALLLILAACDPGTGPSARGKSVASVEDARVFRARLEMRQLAADLEQHRALRGDWPEDWAAVRRSGKDPWGGDYAFETEGESAIVFSAGPDGEFGTDDDLASR
jgi:hypothetical protein